MDYRCWLGNSSTPRGMDELLARRTIGRSSSFRPSRLFCSFVPALLLFILTPLFLPFSFVSLFYFILAIPMPECFGRHSCMSSTFPIAILNGTCIFSPLQLQVHNVYLERKSRNTYALVNFYPKTKRKVYRFPCTVVSFKKVLVLYTVLLYCAVESGQEAWIVQIETYHSL